MLCWWFFVKHIVSRAFFVLPLPVCFLSILPFIFVVLIFIEHLLCVRPSTRLEFQRPLSPRGCSARLLSAS